MKKDLENIVMKDFEQALSRLGYRITQSEEARQSARSQVNWRNGSFHVKIFKEANKVLMDVHQDVSLNYTYGVGFKHKTVRNSPNVKQELARIMQQYKQIRRQKIEQ